MTNESTLREEISDFLSYYGDSVIEQARSKLIQITRSYGVYLIYKELERVRPKLGYKERMDLTLHHIKNETEFYKRITEPIFNEK
ncbi:hypothetical protein HYW20_01985 [Candidatus Woesearchaeota archaeon]|nr:hypothetical protein [Candidatus Woesearchaeota archaeon]